MIEAALNYNEQKAQRGKAVCLYANGYLKEANEMNFYEKLRGFERLTSLNDRAATKTLHVSLNFDPSEKLSDDKLTELATCYMEKIGFGEQPFLVYKHEDAGHPHIHIVSTTIRSDGSRIPTHNIGRNQSEKARKETEHLFGLIKAEKQGKCTTSVPAAITPEKAIYGKHETKGAISAVVTAVFSQYKFSSLPEYNAALRQFNVVADRGKEDSRIHRHRGLVYRILDGNGKKVGVPIKASTIPCNPTLANLERKFRQNESGKEPLKSRVKKVIDDCLPKSASMTEFVAAAKEQKIFALLRQNDKGIVYGITYVDNQTGCVFNGSDLGKGYSAAAVQNRLSSKAQAQENGKEKHGGATATGKTQKPHHQPLQKQTGNTSQPNAIVDALLSTKEQHEDVPANLLNKKRKKKRRRDSNI